MKAIYDGFSEMMISGLQSEFKSNRLSPPIFVNLLKDADPIADVLELAEMKRKIESELDNAFGQNAKFNRVDNPSSSSNDLIQIADLFTASLGRWLNQGIPSSPLSPKDKLADHIGSFLGWRPSGDGRIECRSDVCNLIYL